MLLCGAMSIGLSVPTGQLAAQASDTEQVTEADSSAAATVAGDEAQKGQPLLTVRYLPTDRAQLALWLEDADGTFLKTIGLTEATALRGIGNRPGASQMNSGFRWPYGRREGVLPTWAQRRLTSPGAVPFRRVIFQDRESEGLASRTSADNSPDDYFCLSFTKDRSSKDALDAVSCATVFSSDKGRYISEGDLDAEYGEPFEAPDTGEGIVLPLGYYSPYPPRRDVRYCEGCQMHPDVATFRDHAREVMPEIDAVTMATPKGGQVRTHLLALPEDWEPGDYRLCLEANVEGDYNDVYNASTYPTPTTPKDLWDERWAVSYGYPYRGQPSVVYCVPFELADGQVTMTYGVHDPEGTVGSWDHRLQDFGLLQNMDTMTDDPVQYPGQGADRLQTMVSGNRLEVTVESATTCLADATPTEIQDLQISAHGDELHAHEWVEMAFSADLGELDVNRYEVRVSTRPITDEASFMSAEPAKAATIEAEALEVPTDIDRISVEVGGLIAEQHYYLGVRAVDTCAEAGPLSFAEFDTPRRTFTMVSPCFVATAAYGTPLAEQVGTLRRFRDRHLLNNELGRWLVAAYYETGPAAASYIEKNESLRRMARIALSPLVQLSQWLSD